LKAILDPFVFWLPPAAQRTQTHINDVLRSIDLVVNIGRRGLQVATTKAVWQRIHLEFVKPLSTCVPPKDLTHRIQALQQLVTIIEPPVCNGQTWGVSPLFEFQNIPNSDFWMTDIASLATYWIDNDIANDQAFVFLTRLFEGRNLTRRSTGHCVIFEKSLWKVAVQSGTSGNVREIYCISSLRNLDVEWTIRYDDRLPDTSPAGGLSFAPAATWRLSSTVAVRTIQSKPTWVDAYGNGWSDTSTPGIAHHWDVFLNESSHRAQFGDDHVNITCWGTSDRGRTPGSVHH
jgi:hypothetical protein